MHVLVIYVETEQLDMQMGKLPVSSKLLIACVRINTKTYLIYYLRLSGYVVEAEDAMAPRARRWSKENF
jgi:hypothetical protein